MAYNEPSMSIRINLKYDGKVFIPQGPVKLPVGKELTADISVSGLQQAESGNWRSAFDRFLGRGVKGVILPNEALSRDSIYPDRI